MTALVVFCNPFVTDTFLFKCYAFQSALSKSCPCPLPKHCSLQKLAWLKEGQMCSRIARNLGKRGTLQTVAAFYLCLYCVPVQSPDLPDWGVWVGLLRTRDCRVQAKEICIYSILPIVISLTLRMVGCHKLQKQENLHMHSNYFFRLFYQIKDLTALKHLIRNNSTDTCYWTQMTDQMEQNITQQTV